MQKLTFKILLCLLLISNFCFAIPVSEINPTDYVTDYTNTLTSEQVLELSKKLGELERAKNVPVAVVMIDKMIDDNGRADYIEHYAVKLFEKLKIGDAKTDEGLLWLIVNDERLMRMEVGYGLEPILTDGLTKIIQDNFVRPEFKQNNYFNGVNNGIDEIIKVIAPELVEGVAEVRGSLERDLNGIILFLLIVFVNLFGWLVSILARTKSWYLGGIITFLFSAITAYSLFGIVAGSVVAVFIITILGFVLDFFVSKNYKYWQNKFDFEDGPSGRPAWWAGGTWGPGSSGWTGRSGGSGFGGFGGGGMSGGGGSNSSW